MKSAMFDALEYMDDLKKSGIEQEQAEAMTKAMAKAFSQMLDNQQLATKVDLKDLKMELQSFIVKSVISTIGILGGIQAILLHYIK